MDSEKLAEAVRKQPVLYEQRQGHLAAVVLVKACLLYTSDAADE